MNWFQVILSAVQWAIENGHSIIDLFDEIRNHTGGNPENFTMADFEAIKASKLPAPPTLDELRAEEEDDPADPAEPEED